MNLIIQRLNDIELYLRTETDAGRGVGATLEENNGLFAALDAARDCVNKCVAAGVAVDIGERDIDECEKEAK